MTTTTFAAQPFDRDLAILLGIGFVATVAGWFAVFASMLVATRVRDIEATPAGLELGGDHSPAVAGLLANELAFDASTVTATAVDLAARGHLVLERAGVDEYVVGLGAGPGPAVRIAPYEQQVLDLVRSMAHAGPVPVAAIEAPAGEGPGSWLGRFEASVRRELREAGLARPRWSPLQRASLLLLACVPAGLLGWIAALLPDDTSDGEGDPLFLAVFVGVVVLGVLMRFPSRTKGDRDTPAGRAAASRWLGLRDNLDASGGFADLPPTAIAVWDRTFAYATAFGLARATLRAMPIAPESPDEAWSDASGTWRLVHIDHGRAFGLRGRAPWRVLLRGLTGLAIAASMFGAFGGVLGEILGDLGDTTGDDGSTTIILLFAGTTLLIAVPALVYGGIATIAGLVDLGRSRTVRGRVLRHRGAAIAVDDGTRRRIRSLPVVSVPLSIHEGGPATVTHSPLLGFVRAIH